jgi:hypothetical protein
MAAWEKVPCTSGGVGIRAGVCCRGGGCETSDGGADRWPIERAWTAKCGRHTFRAVALALLQQAIDLASVQLARGSPFVEWQLLKWTGEVQTAVLQKAAGNPDGALNRFRVSQDMEKGLEAVFLQRPELALARWGARNDTYEIHLSRGDMASAKQALVQMLQLAK